MAPSMAPTKEEEVNRDWRITGGRFSAGTGVSAKVSLFKGVFRCGGIFCVFVVPFSAISQHNGKTSMLILLWKCRRFSTRISPLQCTWVKIAANPQHSLQQNLCVTPADLTVKSLLIFSGSRNITPQWILGSVVVSGSLEGALHFCVYLTPMIS